MDSTLSAIQESSIIMPLDEFKEIFNTKLETYLYYYSGALKKPIMDLVKAGGKRIRPYLVYLCSCCGEENADSELLLTGAIPELIHTASLAHDDIIDNAQVRRGLPTIHTKWNTKIAILSGDLILSFVLRIMSRLDTRIPSLIVEVVNVLEDMIEGQALEDNVKHSGAIPEIDILKKINNLKTGSLFSLSFYLGTALRTDNSSILAKSREAGRLFGEIFQIYDDILDIFGNEGTSDKDLLRDIKEGTITIPYAITGNNNDGFLSLLTKYKRTFDHKLLCEIKETILKESGESIILEVKQLVLEYGLLIQSMELTSSDSLLFLIDNFYKQIEKNLTLPVC